MHVVRPGFFTTVQDAGRFGLQQLGIGPGGAMDQVALRVANFLVGNDSLAAALEITLIGPVLRFEDEALIAIHGAQFPVTIGGESVPLGRAVLVRSGTELTIGSCSSGCRAYLAVAGGIDVAIVLGSRSTNLRAHFGGFEGRALRAGDRVPVGTPSGESARLAGRLVTAGRRWQADTTGFSREFSVPVDQTTPLRMIPGAEFTRLDEPSRTALLEGSFRVSAKSDRMGYRLDGPVLTLTDRREMTSEGVTWGTVQLPPDGQPIILLADRQTTGGYPVIGHVASVDRGVVAQRKPGDSIRFVTTTLEEAQRDLVQRDQTFAATAQALRTQRARELA